MAGDDTRQKTVQVSIPEQLHRQFRVRVANEGTTMATVLREAIEEYVRRGADGRSGRGRRGGRNDY